MGASDPRAGAPSEPEDSAPATLGQTLKNARVARDLTLEQLATELRIEVQQLAALEQDRLDRIGPPVFIKGYLRQYGARLGLDHRALLSLYYDQAKHQEVVVQPSRSIKLRDERQITIWIVAAVVLAVVAVLLVFWWMNDSTGPATLFGAG
jgi:cytoskeleton protein RodZ